MRATVALWCDTGTRTMPRRFGIFLIVLAACGGGGASDAGRSDAAPPDAAEPDAGGPDASLVPAWCDPDQPLRRQLTAKNNAATPLPAGFQVDWLIDIDDLAVVPLPHGSLHLFHTSPTGCMELDRVIDDGQAAYEG